MSNHKSIVLLNILFLLFSLSVLCAKEVEPEIKVITDMQDKYKALSETIPAICMLPASGTSAIPAELITNLDQQLARQMIIQGMVKPVLMNKYLSGTFLAKKAATPFALLQGLADERYTVPLQGVCKPYIFKNESVYTLRLAFYRIRGTMYPVEIFRTFTDPAKLNEVIDSCLEEFSLRYFEKDDIGAQKRILIREFALEFRKLVELASGEFEFVSSPFIQQTDFSLKDGDDYFGMLLGYVLSSTGMFKTVRLADFKEFSETNISLNNNADYVIQGRVQLTDQLCFLYVDLFESRRGAKIVTIKHPVRGFNMPALLRAFREISYLLAQRIFPADSFDLVPNLSETGNAFYYQNTLIGWDTLEYFFLPKGMHKIDTGTYLRQGTPIHTYFILFDTEKHVFMDREGKYAWNLLQK